jgi:hypothetical protein
LSTGTRTSSKITWFTSRSPPMVMIGRIEMPGNLKSTSMKLMPSCCRSVSARAHEHEHVVRELRVCGPDLGAVDDVVVAVADRARA